MNEGKVIDLLLAATSQKHPEIPAMLDQYKGCLFQVHRLLSRQRDILAEVDDEWPAEIRARSEAEALRVQNEINGKWRICFEAISGRLFPV